MAPVPWSLYINKAMPLPRSPMLCLLVLASCFLPTREHALHGGKIGLYPEDTKLFLVNETSFEANVLGSERAWVVEFYASWCGHCQRFAPIFDQFATDIYGWKDLVSVAAMDCAAEENAASCRKYEVQGYPTLKFFAPGTLDGDIGVYRDSYDQSISSIMNDAIDFIESLQKSEDSRIATYWPNLIPFQTNGSDLQDLWTSSQNNSFTILFLEYGNSYTGAYVMLDMAYKISTSNVSINMRRIQISDDGSDQDFLDELDLPFGQPGMVALNRDLNLLNITQDFSISPRLRWRNAIEDFINENGGYINHINIETSFIQDDDFDDEENIGQLEVTERDEVSRRRYTVFMSDMEHTIFYALSQEVSQHVVLEQDAIIALKSFAAVLHNFFPGSMEMTEFLKDFYIWIHEQSQVTGEQVSNWISNNVTFETSDGWIGCKGSEDRFGGYPCGLWTLWHTLTVSQAYKSTGDPKMVMTAMKQYVQEFFGCRNCAEHFAQKIENGSLIERDINSYDDAILLLWKVHNQANLLLHNDPSEDPLFPKKQFPTKRFCPECYVKGTKKPVFNETFTLEFLKNHYGTSSITSPIQRRSTSAESGSSISSHSEPDLLMLLLFSSIF